VPGLSLIALVGSDRLLHLIVATSFAELVELKPETEAHPTQIKADGDDSKLWLHYSLRRQPGRALSALDRSASPQKAQLPHRPTLGVTVRAQQTQAYLGLAAFTLVYRRLAHPGICICS